MKKTILTAVAVLSLAAFNAANAQISFSHSVGGGLYASSKGAGWALMYAPRLNVVELADEMTVSVGTNLGLGLSGSANSREGGSGTLLLDLPILAELNIGHAANNDANSDFGGFVGVGFGYSKMASSVETNFGTSSSNVTSTGVLFSGGLRAVIKGQSVGLRVSYMLNGATDGANVFGLGLHYNIGMD